MAYVITRLCRDCKDLSCVKVCPAACIFEHVAGSGTSEVPNQLFIDPVDCVDCNACMPECPWEAIFPEADVPEAMKPDVGLNALVRERPDEFRQPDIVENEVPTAAAVKANKERWELGERRTMM